MRLLFTLAVVAGAACMAAPPALADTVRSCAELTNPTSPNFDTNRDTWWRYTDERGMSCANADMALSDDGLSDDEDEDAGPSKANGGRAKDGKAKAP
jgi:hypothetical protein